MTEPTYEMFTRGKRRGELTHTEFIASLEEGVPTRIPDYMKASSIHGNLSTLRKITGFKVIFREIDGVAWVCRLKPEDVPHA